jgi:hypothetical protein
MSKIIIDFIPNNFRLDKNMQGLLMHDNARCHDDAKKKRTNKYLLGEFFRVVTIDTTNKGSRPEIHVMAGEELGKLSDLHAPC